MNTVVEILSSKYGFDVEEGKKYVEENVKNVEKKGGPKKEKLCDNISFTEKERQHYVRQSSKCHFKTPDEEYNWAKTQLQICTKCSKEKALTEYNGNTSSSDAFDKSGIRLRRKECKHCTANAGKGKTLAKKLAKKMGISYVAPKGTLCAVCKKPASSGNGMVFEHCHVANVFRGYCCNSCNRSIGVLGDDVDGVLRVLNYLLKTEKVSIFQNENGELVKV